MSPLQIARKAHRDAHRETAKATATHTPRTAKALWAFNEAKGDVVSADFARELERENIKLKTALKEIVWHATKYGAAPLSATKMFDRANAALSSATL